MMKELQIGAIASDRQNDKLASLLLYWTSIRGEIFKELEKRNEVIHSTEDAIIKYIVKYDENNIGIDLFKLYHFAMIAEYASGYDTMAEIEKFISISKKILSSLNVLVKSTDIDAINIADQLNEYIDDAKSSSGSHFKAAERYEFWSKTISFILMTASALTAFLSTRYLEQAADKAWISISISALAMISAGFSILNATNDFKNRLEKHRVAANKYIAIKRDAIYLISEISTYHITDENRNIYFEKLQSIKNVINGITQDAPQIPNWAWKKYKDSLRKEGEN